MVYQLVVLLNGLPEVLPDPNFCFRNWPILLPLGLWNSLSQLELLVSNIATGKQIRRSLIDLVINQEITADHTNCIMFYKNIS